MSPADFLEGLVSRTVLVVSGKVASGRPRSRRRSRPSPRGSGAPSSSSRRTAAATRPRCSGATTAATSRRRSRRTCARSRPISTRSSPTSSTPWRPCVFSAIACSPFRRSGSSRGRLRAAGLLLLGKIREVLKRTRGTEKPRYDQIVLDAPATGHALPLLSLPRTILKTVPAGPLRQLALDVDAFFSIRRAARSSPSRSRRARRDGDEGSCSWARRAPRALRRR